MIGAILLCLSFDDPRAPFGLSHEPVEVAAALRGVIGQRLSVLNERLTQHMIAIDSVELPAATAEAARPVRKALLVRADELCARVGMTGEELDQWLAMPAAK